jgi:4a-hydroxytetrahydrobiopterin dehydratase
MTALADQHCAPCNADTAPLDANDANARLKQLSDRWAIDAEGQLVAELEFKNYGATVAFVNAVAYIARREKHHPDISFGYNNCRIALVTHAIDGLSDNDFIVAARVDRLLDDA